MRLSSGLIAMFGAASLVASLGASSAIAEGILVPETPSISNLPAGVTFGDSGFIASVATNSDGTQSVTSSTPSVCIVDPSDNLTVTYAAVGTCTLTAHTAASILYDAADGDPQSFTVAQGTPSTPSISNLPAGVTFGDSGFTAIVSTDSDGTPSVTSSTPSVCTVDPGDNLTIGYTGAGTCTLTAHVSAGTDYLAADGTAQTFSVGQATPATPRISNLPIGVTFGDAGFTATLTTNSDGTPSVTSSTPSVCTVDPGDNLTVTYSGAGTCTLMAHTAVGTDYAAADGISQDLAVAQATPSAPSISNLPPSGIFGGSFVASVATNGDGSPSLTSNSASVCTVGVDGLTVSYVGVGTCSLSAHVSAGTNYLAADGTAQTFSVGPAPPNTPSIDNIPVSATFGAAGFTSSVSTNSDGTPSVTSSTPSVCTVDPGDNLTVGYSGAGTCTLTAHTAASSKHLAADGTAQSFAVAQATPSAPSISNLPSSGTFGGSFVASVATNGDGSPSLTSNSASVCTVGVDGLTVSYVGVGTCSLSAHVSAGTDYLAADGTAQTFSVGQATPATPRISNLPIGVTFGDAGFTATLTTNSDGTPSVTSSTPSVCTVDPGDNLTVTYSGAGTCTLMAHTAVGTDYAAADGISQDLAVAQATPSAPSISNLPPSGIFGGSFVASVATNGDGSPSLTSNSASVCTVGVDGLTVSYVGVGTCSLSAHVSAGTNYLAADGTAQTFSVGPAPPNTPSIDNIPVSATFGAAGFTSSVSTNSDGTPSVTSSTPSVCTVDPGDNLTVTYSGAGTCTLTAHTAASSKHLAADGTAQSFAVAQATPSAPSISNLPSSGTFGGSFVASVATNGDGSPSLTSNSASVCTVGVDGLTVSYVGVGTCSLSAHVSAGTDYLAADGTAQTFSVDQAPPNAPSIDNIPVSATFGDGGFTATLTANSDGTPSVTSSTPSVCTVDPGDHLTVTYAAAGSCTLTAHTSATATHLAADGTTQGFKIAQATPTAPTISNLPLGGTFGGSFVASVATNGDGSTSVASNNSAVCTVDADGLTVRYVGVGTCVLTAHVASGTDYLAASGNQQSAAIQPATPSAPSISNIPSSRSFGGSFGSSVSTNADGTKSVTSSTPGVCSVGSDLRTVSFIGIGTCTLIAHVAAGSDYAARDGGLQSFTVNRAVPARPSVSNIPSVDTEFGGFTARVGTNGDGTRFVASNSTGVCTVGPDGVSVTFVGYGTCSLTAGVAQGSHYLALERDPPDLHRQLRPAWLLAGGVGRRDLLLRRGRLPRLHGWSAAPAARGGHHTHRHEARVLAGRVRRRHLQLRRFVLLRLHPRPRGQPRRVRPGQQPRCAHRRHGAVEHRPRLLHGRLRRWRVRLR